jgi:hypothetical protein
LISIEIKIKIRILIRILYKNALISTKSPHLQPDSDSVLQLEQTEGSRQGTVSGTRWPREAPITHPAACPKDDLTTALELSQSCTSRTPPAPRRPAVHYYMPEGRGHKAGAPDPFKVHKL